MKYSVIFRDRLGCNDSEKVFEYFLSNLKETIRSWDFFVAWDKVTNNIGNIEVVLNIINYLIGKKNIREEFKNLVSVNDIIKLGQKITKR